jgi:CRP-like cAMP-binding protein
MPNKSPAPAAVVGFIQSLMPMPPEKAAHIAQKFMPKTVKRHEYVLREGKICQESLFVESGYIRAFVHDPDGNEVTINIYQPNSFVNNLVSFFRREPSSENFQAVTDCTAWAIPYDTLQTLFHGMPEFREFGRMLLIMSNLALKDRMVSMIRNTAEERYTTLLRSNPDVFQHVPLKMIASYLGITDTSLSRIRREFSQK